MDFVLWPAYKFGNNKRKFMIYNLDTNKKIFFGDFTEKDFTDNQDLTKKAEFYLKHKQTHDPKQAGFWTSNLLWNKETLEEAIEWTEREYNLDIEYKL